MIGSGFSLILKVGYESQHIGMNKSEPSFSKSVPKPSRTGKTPVCSLFRWIFTVLLSIDFNKKAPIFWSRGLLQDQKFYLYGIHTFHPTLRIIEAFTSNAER